MTSPIRLEFCQPGLCAPVYVVTSMSDPQWSILEMDHRADANGKLTFYKDFAATPGKHQYKYRLGPGDWWVLDESKPSVHDDAGNRNNLVIVDAPELPPPDSISLSAPIVSEIPKTDVFTPDSEPDAPLLKHETLIVDETMDKAAVKVPGTLDVPAFRHEALSAENAPSVFDSDVSEDDFDEPEAPMLRHESFLPNFSQEKKIPNVVDSAYQSQDGEDHSPPLFSHESFVASEDDSEDEPQFLGADDDSPEVTSDHDSHHDHDAPLLPHEISLDLDDTPLFRHESIFMNSSFNSCDDAADASMDPDKECASLEDSGVQVDRFPIERDEIMRHLVRVSSRLPEDEISFQSTPPSSPLIANDQFRRRSSSLRTSITADSFSHLEPIKEADEPRSAAVPSSHQKAPSSTSPADLLTPPMTPDLGAKECMEKMPATLVSAAVSHAEETSPEIKTTEEIVAQPASMPVPATIPTKVQSLFGDVKKRVSSFSGRTILAVVVGLAAAIAYKWQSLRTAVA